MLSRLQIQMLLIGTILMLSWVGFFSIITAKDVYALRERESAMRGLIVAEALANSIGRALEYGIEIDQLLGIDQVFAARIKENQDIVEIALDDPDGRARVPLTASKRQGISVSATVKMGTQNMGRVTVYLREISFFDTLRTPLSVALLVLLAFTVSAWEAIRFSIRRGPGLREVTTNRLLQQVLALDFTNLVKETRLKRLDLRSAWLSYQVRDLNERFVRIFRLIVSLRHTEPNDGEQARLMALADQARGEAQFAPIKPWVHRPNSTAVDMRWLAFITTTALSVNLFMFDQTAGASTFSRPFTLGLALLAAVFSYLFAQRFTKALSIQATCLSGLLLVAGVPLVFLAITLLGKNSLQTDGQVYLVLNLSTADLSQLAIKCLPAMGLGVFFAGLGRFNVSHDSELRHRHNELPLVVLTSLFLVGAPLAVVWSGSLGTNEILAISSALGLTAYFFFAISDLSKTHGSTVVDTAAATGMNSSAMAASGFVWGTMLGAVTSGVFPPPAQIGFPSLSAGPVIAIGAGFVMSLAPIRVSERFSGVFAFLSSIVVFAGLWSEFFANTIATNVALSILTYHLVGVLRNSNPNSNGKALSNSLNWFAVAGALALLAYSADLYWSPSSAFPWFCSVAACLMLLLVRRNTPFEMTNVT